jgi:hypothetical protein
MWYKFALAISLIVALAIISSQNKEPGTLLGKYRTMTRQATNVVMYERKRDTGKSMIVSAKALVEIGDRISNLKDFHLVQQKGVTMSGLDATYDRGLSTLTVKGPLDIETSDGARAQLDGLVWNRENQKAYTSNPVKILSKDGTIVASSAEFAEGFSQITLIGSVHAQIAQNFLNH